MDGDVLVTEMADMAVTEMADQTAADVAWFRFRIIHRRHLFLIVGSRRKNDLCLGFSAKGARVPVDSIDC